MKNKFLNVLTVICLAIASLSLTFAICLPVTKTSGANVSPSSAADMPTVSFAAVSASGAERSMFAPVADYFPSGSFGNHVVSAFKRQPAMVTSFTAEKRKLPHLSYNLPPNRSLFDTPLFKNSKTLKQPARFSQTETRRSSLWR